MANFSALKRQARKHKSKVYTIYLAAKDKRTPLLAKFLGVAAVLYILNPIDIVPDFIPILGWLDDVLIIGGMVWLLSRIIPPEVWKEAWEKSDAGLGRIKRLAWAGVLLFILFWAIIILFAILIVKKIWGK